jgi:Cu/Ag efflux protein CusF
MNRFNRWVLGVPALALLAGLAVQALADDKPARRDQGTSNAQGKIERVDADKHQLVLRDAAGRELRFQVGRDAHVRVNGRDSKLADLKAGDRVNVSYQAMAREVRSGERAAGEQHARGTIQSVDAGNNRVVVKDNQGKERTFQVGKDARIRVHEKERTLSDLKAGDHVAIRYVKEGERLVARGIRSAERGRQAGQARGKVESVDAGNHRLVVKSRDGKEHAFRLAKDARVHVNGRDGKLADLRAGDEVSVAFQLVAQEIRSGNK